MLLGSATVRAPGVCGELAQGVIEGIHFLVTCPVDFYSRVKVDIYSNGPGVEAPEDCEKTAAAVRRTLSHLQNAKVRAKLTINNPRPRGKGMASSSADLAAAIAATAPSAIAACSFSKTPVCMASDANPTVSDASILRAFD